MYFFLLHLYYIFIAFLIARLFLLHILIIISNIKRGIFYLQKFYSISSSIYKYKTFIYTMPSFFQEIQEQPQALLQTANFYKSVEGKSVLSQISELWCSGKYRNILLTGMGSSYFIANATASLLNSYKIPAICSERRRIIALSNFIN